ncbi:nuclear transport factor 2 family protein [Dactylosporangium vinaceum]|uniref:Nuclear transport factor 2 family protein n=1 Tax=Dactylosporangium vinaceum TaxID=53362 RepID=A0ABV5MFW0_9ACTN|nr:nuclear transport factor 2 family protein [Dactylosporangium vinaceum]UAB98861.1 nuclear transport factor 2 family protein [Dactylosporangium vinaceum]
MTTNDDTAVAAEVSLALAERLVAAIDANDLDALRNEVYTPDIVVWHNDDQHEQRVDENLKVLNWLHRKVAGKRYEDVVRHTTPTGYVEQHVLRGTAPNGTELEIHACLVVRVRDGRIARIDEYLDSRAAAALRP